MDIHLIAISKLDPRSESFFGSPFDEESYYREATRTGEFIERATRAVSVLRELPQKLRAPRLPSGHARTRSEPC